MNKFYVYVFLDPRKPGSYIYNDIEFNFEPFYIGKGKGNRIELSKYDKLNLYKFNKINKIEVLNLGVISYKLFENLSEGEAFSKEIEIISKIGKIIDKKGPLVNFSDGGSGGDNLTHHPNLTDIKFRMSNSHMCEKNSFYGKKHSEETLKIISEKTKGKNKGELNSFYGKKHSEETKKIISEINKTHVGENNHFYGKNHSEESKEKIRQKAIGRKRSEEAKIKTSESLKQKNWGGINNPVATKYIIQSPNGTILEFNGREDMKEKLKGVNYRKILEEKEHKGYKLLDKIRINSK